MSSSTRTLHHTHATKSRTSTVLGLSLYVVSGAFQPILVTQLKLAGLGDPTCQLYMFFYYLGPALVAMHLYFIHYKKKQRQERLLHPFKNLTNNDAATFMEPLQQSISVDNHHHNKNKGNPSFPKRYLVYAAMFIAMIDIIAQAMNYTGSTLAGPTVFAILYSSVGIWTALYSRVFFRRKLTYGQLFGVFIAFGGLILVVLPSPSSSSSSHSSSTNATSIDSTSKNTEILETRLEMDPDLTSTSQEPLLHNHDHHSHHHHHSSSSSSSTTMTPEEIMQQQSVVTLGTLLIFFGSMIHAFTYIMSEAIMHVDAYLSFMITKTTSTKLPTSSTTTVMTPPTHRRHHSIPSTSSALIISSQSSSTQSLQETVLHKEEQVPTSVPQMSSSTTKEEEDDNHYNISIVENAFIQGCTALTINGLWQLIYTVPRFQRLIYQPMILQQTSLSKALFLLLTLSTLNAMHSLTFYYTLKHVQGGATTAAVMKGLQAVMVFCFSWLLDLKTGTNLFSWNKCCSLFLVVTGVVLYGSLSHSGVKSSTSLITAAEREDAHQCFHQQDPKEERENKDDVNLNIEEKHLNGQNTGGVSHGYGAITSIQSISHV